MRGTPPYKVLAYGSVLKLKVNQSDYGDRPLWENGIDIKSDMHRLNPNGTFPEAFVAGLAAVGGSDSVPTGLLISYGCGDSTARLLHLSRDEVDSHFI